MRADLPSWPRLMCAPLAAAYLSISPTSLRTHGPKPKHLGKRRLFDKIDLDRWADSLSPDGTGRSAPPLTSKEVERRFLDKRALKNK